MVTLGLLPPSFYSREHPDFLTASGTDYLSTLDKQSNAT